jgi:hypothetical protein
MSYRIPRNANVMHLRLQYKIFGTNKSEGLCVFSELYVIIESHISVFCLFYTYPMSHPHLAGL